MSPELFLRRLNSGKVVNCIYSAGTLTGLISAWSHDSGYVLTWEECQDGEQYNEHKFTRDERRRFESADQVLSFVEEAGFPPSVFNS